MRIALVIYSETGNTRLVANKIKEGFNNIDILEIRATGLTRQNRTNFKVVEYPNIKDYDMVILGTFVEGFMLAPVMKEYLSKTNINGKKVIGFVTHFFPFHWMGANNAINQMKNICKEKEADFALDGIIDWSNSKRNRQINELIARIGNIIK